MKIVLTNDWSFEKLAPYTKSVTAAMKKLQERFPREVDVGHLANEIISGKRQLWLILEDDDSFISFLLSEIQTNNATGLKTIVLPSFAGEKGTETVHLIGAVEDWGREMGCDEVIAYGRWGWKRAMEKEGYEMNMVAFRKTL